MPIVEYEAGTPFPGVIGRTAEESSQAWPAPVRAKKGAPNVLMIVLDDTGYGNLGCYGSPIETRFGTCVVVRTESVADGSGHDGRIVCRMP